ncbi:MAG: D-alanyl-D-alanine carboxypeptidase, partial [Proteobacteria bacterium]|nr:D-alanyl-D-alanine carboxypeptidase [Pseudomonadota bacterium]
QVLTWMERQGELFPDFLGSLPANGWDGTLKRRIKKAQGLAGMIRAKTGTLTDPIVVAGMAGYYRDPSEGWIGFVMLANGREGRGQPGLQDVRSIQDDTLKTLLLRNP